MANWPSMCLIVLFAVVGKFDVVVSDGSVNIVYPPIATPSQPFPKEPSTFPPIITPLPPTPEGNATIQDSKICPCGKWYAVMATEVNGSGPCNIVSNNKYPCCCTTMDVREFVDSNWEIIGCSENIETLVLTVHMGGATAETTENKEINGFCISEATMPATVAETFPQTIITQNVYGSPMFVKYHMSIIDWNAANFYMITQIKTPNGPDPFYVIWCRHSHPGKNTIWTSILQGLKQLNIDPHSMSFIKQDKCTYPTVPQYDEIFFC